MGSFSYTCQLSGLPITSGDRAAIVPLIPNNGGKYFDNSIEELMKNGKNHVCSNDGANIYFKPFCFPIFGIYNDYGGLEDIVKDDNTKSLEKFFGLKIQKIVDVLCDGRKDGTKYSESYHILKKKNPRHKFLQTVSGTWIHGDVYEKLAKTDFKNYFDRVDIGVHGILDGLGFKYVGEGLSKDDEQGRYEKEYEKDGLKIHSDGNWIHIPGQQIYDVSNLAKYCKKKKVVLNIEEMDKKGREEQIYDYIMPHIDALKGGDRWNHERVIYMLLGDEHDFGIYSFFDDFTDEQFDALLELQKEETKEDLNGSIEEMKKRNKEKSKKLNVCKLYFDEIKEQQKAGNKDFLKKNITEFHKVESFYYPSGRFWYPIGTSCQDGGYKEVKIMLEAALEVVNKSLKERGSEEDED